ncbi:MAG: SbcC/MukB-like Walker B domain-containing protein, partial [Patescibacteria group bacterium]
SLEEFQKQSDVITKEGQFKTGSQRHTKDDRRELWDRRNFVLGWTNKEKILAVEKHLTDLQKEKGEVDSALGKLKIEIANNTTLNTKLNLVVSYTNWNDLNWHDEVREISKLEHERRNLESSNDILKELQAQLAIVLGEIETLDVNQKTKAKEIGGVETNIRNYETEIETCNTTKNSLLQSEVEVYFPKVDELLTDEKLTFKNIDTIAKELNTKFTGKNGEKDKLNEKLSKAGREITKVMKEFKDTYPSESLELSVEIEARTEYLRIFEKIIFEGLPMHEARFKKMLNENTINDIVAFDSKIDNHFKSIKKKIEEINKHLKEIEFNKGTYIKLLDDRNPDPDINNFKRELKECYSSILGTSDAYTEDRFTKVKVILDCFSSNDSKQIEWTNKVTDVRNWFIFNASEKFFEDNSEKEFYAGTSGKSGGQKEKLAYTILASALAYQFGLSYGEPRSKSFRFVVIDEAFGRGDDESTQFGLGLFKKLNLQLLIVTPLQKIHVIENYINSVHYVSNTNGNNSELQNLTVEEYKKQKHLHNALTGVEVTETNS